MRRADRLFQIVQHLRGGKLVTAADLADRLEVSKRTIYRDIADLIGSGVPIDGEAGMGYLMRDGYDLPPLMFTLDEVTALVAGARLVRAWGGASMALGAQNALEKIETVLPQDALARAQSVHIHAMSLPNMDDALRARIDILETHVAQSDLLQIIYQDAAGNTSTRRVGPLGLWFWGKVWTLVAWCELRADFRMFRLDRMTGFDVAGRFDPQPGQSLRDFYALECARSQIPSAQDLAARQAAR